MSDCLKCVSTDCCKLDVEVNRNEYNKFTSLNLNKFFNTRVELFLKQNPKYKEQKEVFDKMYFDNYAILKKNNDGFCVLLNRETMLCSIYNDRPKVCKDYTIKRCANIKKLK